METQDTYYTCVTASPDGTELTIHLDGNYLAALAKEPRIGIRMEQITLALLSDDERNRLMRALEASQTAE